jgi:preprotein translocase subunit SecD
MNHHHINKVKLIVKKWQVIVLIVCMLIALIAISPEPWVKGISIRGVVKNSAAYDAAMQNPSPLAKPVSRERILDVNGAPIKTEAEYFDAVKNLSINQTVQIKTTKGIFRLTVKPKIKIIELNETINQTMLDVIQKNITINGTITLVNETINRTILVNKTLEEIEGPDDLGLQVYPSPVTNLKTGLDLQGGTRVLLQPETKLSADTLDVVLSNMKQRLNVYGLSDILVRDATDLSGNQYILVEIAGINEEEVKSLLAKQGKFEAKVADTTVFIGGQDITYVCRAAECSGLDPNVGCGQSGGQWFCRFSFSISLSPAAAQRQAATTANLAIIPSTDVRQSYLNETLDLYLDNQQVDQLNIGSELRGKAITDIQISGSGAGNTQQEAAADALSNMKRLQTILITGSLPVKLNIIKTDTISPILGQQFVKNAFLVLGLAVLAVVIVLLISYRNFAIAVPILLTSVTEVYLLLGLASIIGWTIDMAAIAGIIAAVGTGVDDQIVITDEVLRGESRRVYNWKDKIKNAFFIIFGSYFTLVVAMLPLVFAGAGLLKGFAITTILGISIGVFITRPAYAVAVEILMKE